MIMKDSFPSKVSDLIFSKSHKSWIFGYQTIAALAMGDSGEQGIPSSVGVTQTATGGPQVSAGATLTTAGVQNSIAVAVAPSTLVGPPPHATIGKTESQGTVTAEVSK